MNSVTDTIKKINQPDGGYLPLSLFEETTYKDNEKIICSIKPLYVGKVIDDIIHEIIRSDYRNIFRSEIIGYESRVDWFTNAFATSTKKAKTKMRHQIIEEDLEKHVEIEYMLSKLKLYAYDNDIKNMLNYTYGIVQYSIWHDNFEYVSKKATVESSRPKGLSKADLARLQRLVSRTLLWLQSSYKDRIIPDYKFYPNGYSDLIKYGVGDFVCDKTLYDIKCIKDDPTIENTLQLLMYYCMGIHSNNKLYSGIEHLGIYSPVLNKKWVASVDNISKELVDFVNTNIISYTEDV